MVIDRDLITAVIAILFTRACPNRLQFQAGPAMMQKRKRQIGKKLLNGRRKTSAMSVVHPAWFLVAVTVAMKKPCSMSYVKLSRKLLPSIKRMASPSRHQHPGVTMPINSNLLHNQSLQQQGKDTRTRSSRLMSATPATTNRLSLA